MPIWVDAKIAGEHLIDLKKVRSKLNESNSNKHRIKVLDDMIRNTEAEAKVIEREAEHFK
jgi:hypothetical protein